ncbi:uncharacterized protein LOC126896790 [Daktulosphaira vitifoliae]|uniref:uncharacterized protein LOC126896790 n=1 Tax=Daktulosphaira vitifoliae TaxID=58002 RepID=UPI0021A9E859|nr:uncharacterized protein LOC126896790 [Daktulosphaira vitifoliae]
MAYLFERIKCSLTICNVFGAGFKYYDTKKALFEYWSLYIINVFLNIFIYHRGMIRMTTLLVHVLDMMSILNVICFHIRILTPLVMVCSKLFADNEVLVSTIRSIDDLIPSLENTSLFSYAWYFYGWIILHIITEELRLLILWLAIKFQFINGFDVLQTTYFDIVVCLPIVQYNMLMLLIGRAIKEINNDITSIRKWKLYRAKWKELKNRAQQITHSVFDISIVMFVAFSMCEIICFGYSIPYFSKVNKINLIICFVITCIRLGFCIELFRVVHICKIEINRTQTILNDMKTNSLLDLKEVQFSSLYMLHARFHLVPCGVFELSFRTLLAIFSMTIAFLAFQIQIKIG